MKKEENVVEEEILEKNTCDGDTCSCDNLGCECDCKDHDKDGEEDRAAIIKQFNEANAGVYKILDVVPTEEDILRAKNEWEEASKKHMSNKFLIADESNSERVAKFLKTWNENDVVWEKDMWQGTIFFNEIIEKFIESLAEGSKVFEVDYGTLTYLYIGMMNVKGVGLEQAKHRKEIGEEYLPILDVVATHIEKFQEDTKEIQKLQERWSLFEMGYYTEIVKPTEEVIQKQ